jgi:hypothetical protein
VPSSSDNTSAPNSRAFEGGYSRDGRSDSKSLSSPPSCREDGFRESKQPDRFENGFLGFRLFVAYSRGRGKPVLGREKGLRRKG